MTQRTQDEKAIVRLAELLADRQRKVEALTGVHNFAFEDADQLIAATIERCAQVAENFNAAGKPIAAAIRKLKDTP